MKKNFIYGIILFLFCNVIGCSTDISSNRLNIKVEFTKINSWLNLMPGSSHNFYLAGEYKVRNNTDSTIKKLELKQVKIYQDKKLIYSFTPFVTDISILESTEFVPDQTREFKFGTNPGLKQKSELDTEKNILIKFTFTSGNKFLELPNENINIEKVY